MDRFRLRRSMLRLLTPLVGAEILVPACKPQQAATVEAEPKGAFAVSFVPGSRDDAGRFMGGTEMRVLAMHAGRLYAGNGYWEDRPGSEGFQGAEILVLDGPRCRLAGRARLRGADATRASPRPRGLCP